MESNLINNIIPRLRALVVKVEVKEAIVDKIWEIYTDEENLHDYQFLRDNRLIMTHQGNVKKGRWELLPGNRLLIERENDSPINLVYDFSLRGVVIMKKAGVKQIPFLLYDQNVVVNGDVESYLVELLKELDPKPIEPIISKPTNFYESLGITEREFFIFLVIVGFISLLFIIARV